MPLLAPEAPRKGGNKKGKVAPEEAWDEIVRIAGSTLIRVVAESLGLSQGVTLRIKSHKPVKDENYNVQEFYRANRRKPAVGEI